MRFLMIARPSPLASFFDRGGCERAGSDQRRTDGGQQQLEPASGSVPGRRTMAGRGVAEVVVGVVSRGSNLRQSSIGERSLLDCDPSFDAW